MKWGRVKDWVLSVVFAFFAAAVVAKFFRDLLVFGFALIITTFPIPTAVGDVSYFAVEIIRTDWVMFPLSFVAVYGFALVVAQPFMCKHEEVPKRRAD